MSNNYALSSVEWLLRDIARREGQAKPFGGKGFGGNFRQWATIVSGASCCEMVENSKIISPLWSMFKNISLAKTWEQIQGNKYLLNIFYE
uniref:DNA helicase Pif1-like DEAD-box helicase domain-containing protein n=1 Tax=Aster yellows phytoplasma TaxID=35779 RepID=Q847P3_ASTYP|nr:hypothetical protein [Aster yellows phytoplasma]